MARAFRFCLLVLCGVASALAPTAAVAQVPPYRDPARPVAERVRDLLGRMTIEEKFWQLFMSPGSLDDPADDYANGAFGLQISVWPAGPGPVERPSPGAVARAHAQRIDAIQRFFVERTRLGIPIIPFEEALHGLTREGATVFPQAIGLAATFDTALMGRVARAIARETRSRGIRQVLSPVVNIANDVRWGRVEETYGEDPYLSGRMGDTFVRAFEQAGVVATPKHFVANVGEGGRDSYPIDFSERMLEELFFPPFESAVRNAGARSIMTAYNSVDGSPATQSRWLLTETLKRQWRFGGFVISDAAATAGATVLHMTEASTATAARHALESGLDVIFQSSWEQHRPYLAAFRSGTIPDSVIDAAVTRVLRAKFQLGLFERPYAEPESAAHWNRHSEHIALARDAARGSLVLLRNERGVLPLDRALSSIAVIGSDAVEARLGGYSATGDGAVSILDGIRERAGPGTGVRYAPGPGRATREHVVVPADRLSSVADAGVVPGLRGEYWDNNRLEGEPHMVRRDARVDFGWTLNSPGRGIPFDWYSVRWTGRLSVPPEGVRRIGIEGNDGYRLWIDDRLVIDNWRKRSFGTVLAEVALEPGRDYELRLEYFESTGNARVRLVWDAGITDDGRARVDEAVTAAAGSDVAIIVAGIEEGEFRDRARLGLPGQQEAMIHAVAATGTPVVVVLVAGSAVTMSSWIEDVDGVLLAWYPGQEGGRAVADVLFGDASPAGRLPVTFPVAEGQLPLRYNHKPTGRGDDYLDLTGQPLFPFGFGLSYTEFEYSDLSIAPAAIASIDTVTLRFRVRNTGPRAGDEVAQLYIRDILASVARPVMELKGFERIRLEPGEAREVTFRLGAADLWLLDEAMRRVVEPGTFRVMIGGSSKDIRLRGHFDVR